MDGLKKIPKPRKPKLLINELYTEISKRIHAPVEFVEEVMRAYQSVVYQCITNQIEVPLGTIGKFSYNLMPPREYKEWNSFYNPNGKPVIFFINQADGYIKPSFHFYKNFLSTAKEKLVIPYGSMPCGENIIERHPVSDIYIDYKEYCKQKIPETNASDESLEILSNDINDIEEYDNSEYDEYDSLENEE